MGKLKTTFIRFLLPFLAAIFLFTCFNRVAFTMSLIPTKSMVPTLVPGDHVFVNNFAYGLRVPFTRFWITQFRSPDRGDIVTFDSPSSLTSGPRLVKRIIGLPGDHIKIEGDEIFVNGKPLFQELISVRMMDSLKDSCFLKLQEESEEKIPQAFLPIPFSFKSHQYNFYVETWPSGRKYLVQRSKILTQNTRFETIVPKDHYFVLGDNRDRSGDSRFWGLVPRHYLQGKVERIWFSIYHEKGSECGIGVYWDRLGKKVF